MPHMPFLTYLLNSDRETCVFYGTCFAVGALVTLSMSFQIIRGFWKSLQCRHITTARVVEKQRRKLARYTESADFPQDIGDLSFENGVLDDYTLWLEIMDRDLVRRLGIQSVCGMNGFDYRESWNDIPKNAEAKLCLEQENIDSQGGGDEGKTQWVPKWMELKYLPEEGKFDVYE